MVPVDVKISLLKKATLKLVSQLRSVTGGEMAIREVPDSAYGAIRREVDSGRGHSVRRRIAKVMVGYPNNPDIRIFGFRMAGVVGGRRAHVLQGRQAL